MILEKTTYPATSYYLLNSWDMTSATWFSHCSKILFSIMIHACLYVRDAATAVAAESEN